MGINYRTEEEVEYWKGRDPIVMLEKRLAEQKLLSPAQAQKVHDEIQADVDAAMAAAEAAPLPDVSTLLDDVYA